MTTVPRARILFFSFNLHLERFPLAHKIKNILRICFQLFLPNFELVSYVKNAIFFGFGEGEEETWIE